MESNILNPDKLFNYGVHYTIPEFQRRYVWTQEDQWEPLWDDVRNVAESYLEELELTDGDRVQALKRTGDHFLGAVVMQQVPVAAGEFAQHEVIDGQQRMTTLQLLLDAVQQVCEQMQLEWVASTLSDLVTNDSRRLSDDRRHHVFKLWPTRGDREAFNHAMDNGLVVDDFEDSLIVQAHEFFQLQARKWLEDIPDMQTERADALMTAIMAKLQMVVINLDNTDDPNVIFETLNARGTPLEQSDLIKNFVLSDDSLSSDELSGVWGNLDDRWWVEEVRQGRLFRPRLDMLFNYWLAMRTGDDVSPPRVFDSFRSHSSGSSIQTTMAEVRQDFEQYRRFQSDGERSEEEDLFHYRLNVMQLGVITPLLLQLLSAQHDVRVRAFRVLESFLVRRMICRQTTKDYNRLTLELTNRLRAGGLRQADTVVAGFLREQRAYSREWPSNATVSNALETSPLYRLLTRGRLRLVLEGIEGRLRSKSERTDVPKNLTIEHLIPQSWGQHWPLPGGVDEQAATQARNQLIHTIGNLTLLSGPQNKGNGPWKEKKAELLKHAVLNLNGQLMDVNEWHDDAIRARSKRLAELVVECWPGPYSDEWQLS